MRVICPECGHRHTVQAPGVQAMHVGVRARRTIGNQFEYSLTAPADISENVHFATIGDDLILSGAFGAAVGAVFGGLVAALIPDYALHAVGVGSSAGAALAWGWLCAEHNQRLKRVVPWFIEQRANWQRPEMGDAGEVKLVVDHLHRDSYSEAGRSVAILGTLPVDVDRFRGWAEKAVRGDSLAIKWWTGAKKPFSRDEYDSLLAKLREANIVVNLPGKGNALTNPGRHALRRILADTPSPASTEDVHSG